MNIMRGYKECTNCKRILPFESFNKNKTKKYGLESWCRDCKKEQKRLYRKGVRKPNAKARDNEYEFDGEITRIKIYRKDGTFKYVLIDTDDYPLVRDYKWYLTSEKRDHVYAKTNVRDENGKMKPVFLHRLLMGFPKDLFVDHINRNTLDNRRKNLRVVTPYLNNINSGKSDDKTFIKDLKEINFNNDKKKWDIVIEVDGKYYDFGSVSDKFEALHVKTKIKTFLYQMNII